MATIEEIMIAIQPCNQASEARMKDQFDALQARISTIQTQIQVQANTRQQVTDLLERMLAPSIGSPRP